MKTSRVLVIGLALVAIAFLGLWRALAPRGNVPEGTVIDEVARRTEPAPRIHEPLAPGPSPRAQAAEPTSAPSAAVRGPSRSLRIRVVFEEPRETEPENLAVGVSSLGGESLDVRRVGPNEFLVADLPPGRYAVAANAPGFGPAASRATVAAEGPESRTTITLSAARSVRVLWRTDDGRPLRTALLDARVGTGSAFPLRVFVTKHPPPEGGFAPRGHSLARLERTLIVGEDDQGVRSVLSMHSVAWSRPAYVLESDPDVIGTIEIAESGPLWASAYVRDEWMASRLLAPADRELVIVTPLASLLTGTGTVRALVVEEASGNPVEGAGFDVLHAEEPAARAARSDAAGVLIATDFAAGEKVMAIVVAGGSSDALHFQVRSGETTDLGTVRVRFETLNANFRVVAGGGKPLSPTPFELVDADEELLEGRPRRTFTAHCEHDGQGVGILRFARLARSRYVLRCRGDGFDTAPRIVESHELVTSPDAILPGEIVMRPSSAVSLVLEPPFAPGTRIAIETLEGWPLRELDVDEFGLATTDLLRGEYRMHLVEYGRPTGSVPLLVDSAPFTLEIRR